ncbi:FxsA family protein [Chelatococcus sambhunathii]|uniref:FxsA family protein n=1 Tax=Chelatococcus sambhunathii TaxID=363953 RepID=A0ABU1DLL2_9HYPH|nr:FxsA family protein [Chelatococcus sambhunathii]MDR4308884.1 FxsA family protein [Chelatococcus sambhunathii]
MARILGLLLLLPAIELVAFLAVGAAIGFGKAVLLQLAFSLVGVAMIGSLVSDARAKARGGLFSIALDGEAGMRGLAGLLFAVPGFVTDALGIVALAPSLRARLRRFLTGGKAETIDPTPHRPRAERRPDGGMLDLDTREWREVEPAGRGKA